MGEEKQSKKSRHSVATSKKSFDGRPIGGLLASVGDTNKATSPASVALGTLVLAVAVALLTLGVATHVVMLGGS